MRRKQKFSGIDLFGKRIRFSQIISFVLFGIIIVRLFFLQVVSGERYREKAFGQQNQNVELSAQRGSILVRDGGGALVKLALNTTLYEVAVDPKLASNKRVLADTIGPLLYTNEDFLICREDYRLCPEGSTNIFQAESGAPITSLPSFEEAKSAYTEEIYRKIKNSSSRYVLIKKKVHPSIAERLEKIKAAAREKKYKRPEIENSFAALVLTPVPNRYYPDGRLAANVLGFVNNEKKGQYGIEGKKNTLLSGKNGAIEGLTDKNRQIINPTGLVLAENGVDIVLTLDRNIQKKVEEILNRLGKKFKADSGQIIVMNPYTGEILAMANYPSFNPNFPGDAYEMRRTTVDDLKNVFASTPIFKKNAEGKMVSASLKEFQDAWTLGFDPEFYVYRNTLGPGVYINRTVQETYEPGSVFKPVAMAIGIEIGEVTPSTTYTEDGPLKIGKFEIKNATGEYRGVQTMTNVLETSSNVGMSNVAFRIGKKVMYSFLVEKFGLGDYTDINLDQEEPGVVLPKKEWSDATLATSNFGQGFSATPLQIIRAWGALANGGILMEPHIISEIHYPNGKRERNTPQEIRRVISPETSVTISSMLVSSVDNGVAHAARIEGYSVAGKTGSSQVADAQGGYATGEGAVITSFAGYAPAYDPQFLVLVKFDRPRYGKDTTWGSTTAAPTFREVMRFLLEYQKVKPDR